MQTFIPEQALVIMAHPDDTEFFAGGTLAAWAAAGTAITLVVVTSGDKGSDDPTLTPARIAAIRQTEQYAAAEMLGIQQVLFLGEPDGEVLPTLDLRQRLVAAIRRYRPQVVMTTDPARYYLDNRYINHPDHRAVGEVVLAAIFPASNNRFCHPELLAQGLEPHAVAQLWLAFAEQPNHWVDIGATFARKVAAMRCHHSQFKPAYDVEAQLRQANGKLNNAGQLTYQEDFRVMMLG